MKCANPRTAFALLVALCASFGILAAPAAAQTAAPTAVIPSGVIAPGSVAPGGVTDVSPLNVPSAPPLVATETTDEGEGLLDDEDAPALVRDLRRANVGGGMATAMAADPVSTRAAGGGATPAGASIPSAVTDIVTDLKRAEKSVSLEDMARAQDALARLDLLLDIERKINEIEKTREDRKNIGKSMSRDGGSMGRVPASALNLPLTGNSGGMNSRPTSVYRPTTVTTTPSTPAVAPAPAREAYKVDQISGSNGRYRAVLVDGGGKKSTVSEGEKLGAYTVSKISATGVTLADGKDRKVLTVESDGIPMVIRN